VPGRLDPRRALVGSVLGGASLGLFEAAGLGLSGALPADDLPRAAAALGLCGALLGALASPLGLLVTRWSGPRPRRLALALAGAGLLGALLDRFAYAGLYPQAHTLLGLTTVAAAAMAGTLAIPSRVRTFAALSALGACAATPYLVSALLSPHHRLRAPLLGRGGAPGRLLWALPDSSAPEAARGCVFPAARAVEPGGLARGRNVLLLTVDAFPGDLGGPRLAETLPRTVAALPASFRFDAAHAAAPRTTYSVYALLTGRHPHRLAFVAATTTEDDRFVRLGPEDPILLDPRQWKLRHRYPLDDDAPTLAGLLGPHGYASAAVVADVGLLPAAGITREFDRVDDSPYRRNDRRDLGGITSGFSTEAALAWLDAQVGRPFFLWVHYRDPHHPYEALDPTSAGSSARARHRDELSRVDGAVADLLAGLRRQGRLGETIVAVTGDHGEEFRDHGGLYHGTTLYEELVWVPLLLTVPGREGRAIAEPVSLTDLAPTLLDLLGIPSPPLDGRSLVPALQGAALSDHVVFAFNTSYTAARERQAAVIVGTDKLIADEARRTVQLFDLGADPAERENLVDARPERAAELSCLVTESGAFAGPW
jgi:arylsulfatase A-like enzyme